MKNQSSGFTLIEIIITVILMGVIAALAFNSYETVIEKMRAKEAENMLHAVFADIQRTKIESGSLQTLVTLGIFPQTFSVPSDNFIDPGVVSVTSGPASVTFRITRKAPLSYFLLMVITETSTAPVVTCSGGPAGLCARLGY